MASSPSSPTKPNNVSGSNNNTANSNNPLDAKSTIVDPLVAALWGVIPVQAKLFPGDLKEGEPQPADKNLLVPRQGFLLYHMDSLRAHFSPYAANIHSLWLSIKDKTGIHAYVPWHIPTHVVVDRVMSRQQLAQAASPNGPGGSTTSNFPGSPTNTANNNNQNQNLINNINRNNTDQVHYEAKHWGNSFLPLVVYVHFTLPPALKKKQRPDLAATPDTMLTLKDTPGITTLHLYRWLKEIYLTRFGDLVGFEAESIEAGLKIRAIGLRILKAAKDNDPQLITEVRSDILKRQQNAASSIVAAANAKALLAAAGAGGDSSGAALASSSSATFNNNNQNSLDQQQQLNSLLVPESSNNDSNVPSIVKGQQSYCVIVHTFDGAGDKPQFRYKVCRINAAGRSLGRVLPDLIPYFDSTKSNFPQAVLGQDDVLPPQYGSIFVQGLQPMMTTPFEILFDMFQSVDLALHIIWRPAVK